MVCRVLSVDIIVFILEHLILKKTSITKLRATLHLQSYHRLADIDKLRISKAFVNAYCQLHWVYVVTVFPIF